MNTVKAKLQRKHTSAGPVDQCWRNAIASLRMWLLSGMDEFMSIAGKLWQWTLLSLLRGVSNSVEVYDPASNTWSQAASMLTNENSWQRQRRMARPSGYAAGHRRSCRCALFR